MDLRQLRHFTVLAESLNFRRAAERLYIAQPALSVSIRRLEDELGVRLFTRGRRGVELTEAGRAALGDAVRALQAAARVREQALAAVNGEVGTLRVAFVGTATYRLLPQTLQRLSRTRPGIRLELYERNTDAIVAGLESEQFDVGIVRYPMKSVPGMTLDIIEKDRYCVALPAGHRLAARRKVPLRALAGEPFLVPSAAESPALHHLVLSACQRAGFMPIVARQEAVQLLTTLALVESGFGVALIPGSLVERVPQRAVFRPLDERNDHIETGLALLYPAERNKPLLEHFRDAAASAG